ncbi:MAG: acyl-CoA thioesterase [Bdellovibrionaceae bacterium]|nr:acyl-CoA thioesterase [Bdellovibrionales bacterium]MCB9083941.1 acyl-CoA thioesterase [Pseudobdellovibrionaceae bacterium]
MDGVFIYDRRVNFVDTDAMGVVHHANYLHFFEEARVAWLRDRGLIEEHYPYAPLCFAVLESKVEHRRGPRFDDEMRIAVVGRRERLKIRFRYAIYSSDGSQMLATGETLLVPVDTQIKPVRLNKDIIAKMESEPWIETWPSSL